MQHHVEVVRGLVLAKMKITSKLPHAKETPLEKEITYIWMAWETMGLMSLKRSHSTIVSRPQNIGCFS